MFEFDFMYFARIGPKKGFGYQDMLCVFVVNKCFWKWTTVFGNGRLRSVALPGHPVLTRARKIGAGTEDAIIVCVDRSMENSDARPKGAFECWRSAIRWA